MKLHFLIVGVVSFCFGIGFGLSMAPKPAPGPQVQIREVPVVEKAAPPRPTYHDLVKAFERIGARIAFENSPADMHEVTILLGKQVFTLRMASQDGVLMMARLVANLANGDGQDTARGLETFISSLGSQQDLDWTLRAVRESAVAPANKEFEHRGTRYKFTFSTDENGPPSGKLPECRLEAISVDVQDPSKKTRDPDAI